MRNNQVRFGDMLPETSKSTAFWDMGVDSHLKWLLLFSPLKRASGDVTSLVIHRMSCCACTQMNHLIGRGIEIGI